MDARAGEPKAGGAEAGGVSVVESSARWWHLTFYLCFFGTALFYAVVIPWPESLGALVPLAVIVTAYSVLVVPGWPPPGRGQAYVIIMIVCFIVAASITPYGAFLYFFALGHIWMFSTGLREVVAAFVLLALGLSVGIVIRTGGLSVLDVVLQVFLPCAASFGMGYWIHRIIMQSEQRADLLRALREAQDELAQAHRLAGAAAERERVARDIHDTLAQGFTSVVLLSESGLDQIDDSAEVGCTLRAIRRVAQDNLGEARILVHAGQQSWDDSTFLGALRRTCAAQKGPQVHAEIAEFATGLDPNEKIMLLRGLQEALANVRRHAQAATVCVDFTGTEAGVRLRITDDGRGFDPHAVRSATDGRAHFGLVSMRQRAAEVGAQLEIDSAPGERTSIRITMPVRARSAVSGGSASSTGELCSRSDGGGDD